MNTAVGLTGRVDVERIVTQGGVFGPIQCSNSIDTLGKKCYNKGENLFLYKNMVPVMPLSMVDDILAVAQCGQKSLEVNTYINAQIELKKLKFHTPDKNGKSKCNVLHVGIKNALCPNLQVHGTDMGHVNELTYLGDIISGDGKNTKNINSRIAKGHGKINDIMEILEKTSMGQDYFKIALLLRESMFLNSILTNCDVWVGLTKNEVEQLEDLDLILLRKIFQTPFSVPKEAIYLELGCQNLGTVIKSRRLTYLHYLIKQEDVTMLHKFFWTQWNFPAKRNEWTDQVKKDLEEFQFSKDLETLKKISISQFKTQVKKKAKEVAFFSFLEKKVNHSKLENIFYSGLRMQKYLQELNKIDAQMVFSYRTRMANFRENYPYTGGPSV